MFDRTEGKRSDGTPYCLHPIRVAFYLLEADCDETTVIAGLLHDLLEDSETTYEELEARFGRRIAKIVKSLTHGEENDEEILERVAAGGKKAVMVKLADNADNIRTISYFRPSRQASYLEYSKKINDLGRKYLGHNHPLVSAQGAMYNCAYNLPF